VPAAIWAEPGLDRLLIIPTLDPAPGRRGAQNVAAVDGAVRAGVKHIVFISAAGAQQEEPELDAPTGAASSVLSLRRRRGLSCV